ncbi:protein of unknown function, DUF268 [Dyadobacter koreensis]|uniref:DUF268 domain-containing protein n=1 Tax=Dyadobacter koreensis TaxID=408657 RepID=A0A1H6R861_9BACT|nr:DUF268 domain-containing protein [Dyadobacter koreensis]SEI52078.1 protein of unknown function, DUF268 [Dyadobacter koreensis]
MKIIARTILGLGFNPIQLFNSLKGIPAFISDYIKISNAKSEYPKFGEISISPFLGDRYEQGGDMKSVYFQQDLFVAQQVYKNNPVRHLDIGSRTDGFVAHIATFREIDVVDIRAINSIVPNIQFRQSDMMKKPDQTLYDKYDSISSLHAIEHFGLGRYGDPIDLDGHIKAINNIFGLLINKGLFYFAVPIGTQRIEFNAHRVFAVKYLLDIFKDKFVVESFTYIDDNKNIFMHQDLNPEQVENNFGCKYGCGIFILRKI